MPILKFLLLVCECECVRMRACVCESARACARVRARAGVRACSPVLYVYMHMAAQSMRGNQPVSTCMRTT